MKCDLRYYNYRILLFTMFYLGNPGLIFIISNYYAMLGVYCTPNTANSQTLIIVYSAEHSPLLVLGHNRKPVKIRTAAVPFNSQTCHCFRKGYLMFGRIAITPAIIR